MRRHGDEPTDHALLQAVPVEPGLFRHHHVIPRIAVQVVDPDLAGDRADLAGRHLHGERIGGVIARSQPLSLGDIIRAWTLDTT